MTNLLELAKEKLNKQELGYFQMIYPQYLVMMLKGRPGTWKSAILKSIADKLNMVFIDLRLPTMDEVDLGVYPALKDVKGIPITAPAVPEWAYKTLDVKKNFLIVFEELNRTSVAVRNAALGLLLERRIGTEFVFGDNVYMAATGNLGQSDGTDVEEFDTALKSRLITVTHHAELSEWLDNFAETTYGKDGKVEKQGKVHEAIVEFLKAKPTNFYPDLKENEQNEVITNPRTWTALSEALVKNFGAKSVINDFRDFLTRFGKNYVGSRSLELIKFLDENVAVSLQDVLEGKVKDYNKIKRDNKAEIIRSFEIFDPNTLGKKEDVKFARLVGFLKNLKENEHDLLVGGISAFGINRAIALEGTKAPGPRERELCKEFAAEYKYISEQDEETHSTKTV